MGNISGCGNGGWTQVLKINGTKVSFNDFRFPDFHSLTEYGAGVPGDPKSTPV